MRTRNASLLALAAAFAFTLAAHFSAAQPAEGLKQYIYVLHPVERLHAPGAWTEQDNAAVSAHFQRLQDATASGKVILAGKTDEPDATTFGIVIFEATNDAEAKAFMESDPAVVGGVMLAELHPYSVALMRE